MSARAWRLRVEEIMVLQALELDAKAHNLPLRIAVTSDLAQGHRGLVTVFVVWDSGEALEGWELFGCAIRCGHLGWQTSCTVGVVTGTRAEALDPETTAERLALLALVFADEVRSNPALPVLRVIHPDLFADLP